MDKTIAVTLLGIALCASSASASNISFAPQNPAVFSGANPGNTAALMASVDRPEDPKQKALAGAGRLTPGEVVQQGVLSQMSSRIYTQIFSSSSAAGTFDLSGGHSISYRRAGGLLYVTVTDPVRGTTTITLPDL